MGKHMGKEYRFIAMEGRKKVHGKKVIRMDIS